MVQFVQALDLAAQATEHAQFKDWWWKVQLGKCYYRQVTHEHFLSLQLFYWHLNEIIYFLFFVIADLPDFCRLGLYREAEKQFRSALNHQEMVDTYLYLAKVACNNVTAT